MEAAASSEMLVTTCVEPGRPQSTMYMWLSNYRSYTLPQNNNNNNNNKNVLSFVCKNKNCIEVTVL
jgi:hypothetical protein